MLKIIQSNRTENLVKHVLLEYQAETQVLFEPFVVIVPSMVLGDWLNKVIATRLGVSTLVTTLFLGKYQWTLIQDVLMEYRQFLSHQGREDEILAVPEVAVLSATVMQWRLFGYFIQYQQQILVDENHVLYPLLRGVLYDGIDDGQKDKRLWQLAMDLAQVFHRYLTHRDDWLQMWADDVSVDVKKLVAEKDKLTLSFDKFASVTPEWLQGYYVEFEKAQRYLWRQLFSAVHQYRHQIEAQFWQALSAYSPIREQLPRRLLLFTVQQLPQEELSFLQRLSQYVDITLLHYNPSCLFWADIVDKQWLQRQTIINPNSVFLKDYGHTLLSRLGKQSRETFAMLASLSGNEFSKQAVVDWQDDFVDEIDGQIEVSLLRRLQQDILMLDEHHTQQFVAGRVSGQLHQQLAFDFGEDDEVKNEVDTEKGWYDDKVLAEKRLNLPRQWQINQQDKSLSIHSCHSLQRQLEVLRIMIGRWLNEKNADGSVRQVSDIVVLLPDVKQHYELINSVFIEGRGQDGLTLPAKVTGVVEKFTQQLWFAISGFYRLIASDTARFTAQEVVDWLMLPPLYESLGLSHEQMSRACDLLLQAGFVRGFDEQHLQKTLDGFDTDYRFSFVYALDRLVLGLMMPEVELSDSLYLSNYIISNEYEYFFEKTAPLSLVSLSDTPIIEALCRLYDGLILCRNQHQQRKTAEQWLLDIETQIIHPFFQYFDQSKSMRAIFNAMNGFKSSLRANRYYKHYQKKQRVNSQLNYQNDNVDVSNIERLPLKLEFMLNSIEQALESQQVSSEPTGCITFGRFGALRNLPFDLVVMLNMNLSDFPHREPINRYDLMKAGLARRGDRFTEDDDNGAFLDALLCARNACWIFYNGQNLNDNHQHLPASPVSELLQFLQGEIDWQWQTLDDLEQTPSTSDNEIAIKIHHQLPKLIEEWLVTKHPAFPFAKEIFIQSKSDIVLNNFNNIEHTDQITSSAKEQSTWEQTLSQSMQRIKLAQKQALPPAPIWQQVFAQLQQKNSLSNKDLAKIHLPEPTDYKLIVTWLQLLQQNTQNFNQTNKKYYDVLNITAQQFLNQFINIAPNKKPLLIEILHKQIKQAPKLFSNSLIDLERLVYQIRTPAKYFLQEQQIHIVETIQEQKEHESLSLDGLKNYQLNDELLKVLLDSSMPAINIEKKLLYSSYLPAGVARHTSLQKNKRILLAQLDEFYQQIQCLDIQSITKLTNHSQTGDLQKLITPTQEISIDLFSLKIKGIAPTLETKHWLNFVATSASERHLFKYWLLHLFWQISRQTDETQVAQQDGVSIWRFSKASKYHHTQTFCLPPIKKEQAISQLLMWVQINYLMSKMPIVLPIEYAIDYLYKQQKASLKDEDYQVNYSDFLSWLGQSWSNSDTVYESSALHETWQFIFINAFYQTNHQSQEIFHALKHALEDLATPLLSAMVDNLKPIL